MQDKSQTAPAKEAELVLKPFVPEEYYNKLFEENTPEAFDKKVEWLIKGQISNELIELESQWRLTYLCMAGLAACCTAIVCLFVLS